MALDQSGGLVPVSDDYCRYQRLTRSSDFSRVFAGPARSSDEFFTVLGRANAATVCRLGLTVSKRVAKSAVARNRLKRLAREAFRCQNKLPDWDFVVIARPAAVAQRNSVLRGSLERHFQRLMQKAENKRNG